MALTDRQKLEIAIHFGLCRWVHPVDGEPYVFWHADRVTAAFEEVETAACTERDARISELKLALEKAERTLNAAGYTDADGELWKPPCKSPNKSLVSPSLHTTIHSWQQRHATKELIVKIALTLNWERHFLEATPAEIDTVNKVLSRLTYIKDESKVDGITVMEVDHKRVLDFRIQVLPETTQINTIEEN